MDAEKHQAWRKKQRERIEDHFAKKQENTLPKPHKLKKEKGSRFDVKHVKKGRGGRSFNCH